MRTEDFYVQWHFGYIGPWQSDEFLFWDSSHCSLETQKDSDSGLCTHAPRARSHQAARVALASMPEGWCNPRSLASASGPWHLTGPRRNWETKATAASSFEIVPGFKNGLQRHVFGLLTGLRSTTGTSLLGFECLFWTTKNIQGLDSPKPAIQLIPETHTTIKSL